MTREEELKAAFVAGYRSCLYAYAVNKDGELFVGIQRHPYKGVRDRVPTDRMAMADFAGFLRAGREAREA